ncbi:MAG TPA: winged helix-turn-helix domain-containing protein [Rugosimonospora sp.]|nr:winged helix-turn-helix domain-containing protein [Rugosimonospora sp.]
MTYFVPYHQRIADDIRAQIRDGRLKPGEKLPSRPELAELYKVSPGTVDTALNTLKAQGWVRGHQGVGLFVADQPPS